jgi:hypothetical protein
MKFKSMEEISAWLTDTLNERMQMNAEAMLANGVSQEEVDALMELWRADVERCHADAMATIERIRIDPHAPSHAVN